MPQPIDLNYILRLAPADVVGYLQRQGYAISFNWFDVWQEANARAFTVAKGVSLDVLSAIHQIVGAIITEGITERDFIRRLTPELQRLGWWGIQEMTLPDGQIRRVELGTPRRLSTIYQTNLQVALQVGRYKQQIASARQRPFWQYITVDDERVRQSHRAIHQRVWRWDDVIWRFVYPPNGWGCRCLVRTLSQRRLDLEGWVVESSQGHLSTAMAEAGVDRVTGEVVMRPVTIWRGRDAAGNDTSFSTDPGWNYNPGQAWLFDQEAA